MGQLRFRHADPRAADRDEDAPWPVQTGGDIPSRAVAFGSPGSASQALSSSVATPVMSWRDENMPPNGTV